MVVKEFIYHYTKASTLFSMIENNQIWLSKSTFMNDPTEISHALGMYKSEIETYPREERKYFEPLLKWVDGSLKCRDYFIFSLSENSESIPLWKMYGQENGLCLKFDSTKLNYIFNSKKSDMLYTAFSNVIYEEDSQKEMVASLLILYHKVQKENKHFPIDCEKSTDLLFTIFSSLFSFKHKSYKNEEEVRYVFSLPNLNGLAVRDYWMKNINFRVYNEMIVPYIKVDINISDCLKEVILGPKANDDRQITGVKEYLRKKEIDIPVNKASLPYR